MATWTDPVGTILRQSGEVADLQSPDYYPFQKHAFVLRRPVYLNDLPINTQKAEAVFIAGDANILTVDTNEDTY